ncbi:MAG: ABC transporter permease [Patescibacteria group bacterium]
MNTTLTLTRSAIKMFVRNRQSLFFTLFMPLMIMVIFGFVGLDKTPKISLGIVVDQPTAATQQFINDLKKFEAFDVTQGSENAERVALKKGERVAVIIMPSDFFPNPADLVISPPPAGGKNTAPLQPSYSKLKPKTLVMLENVAQQQFAKTAESIIRQMLDKTTLGIVQAPTFFEVQAENVSVKSTKYIDFLVPGILGMALMQMAVFSVAFVFADYKEKGILKRLLATPMKPQQFVTAQVITRLIVALAQSAILLAVGVWLLHTHVYGSLWLVALIAIVGSVMFLGLGFTISGLANTVDSVPAIANLIVFPMLFLGGTFFPISGMPQIMQSIVTYLPLQYLTHSLREVMANGAGLNAIAHDIYWMLGWAVIMVTLAMFTFRFEERRV